MDGLTRFGMIIETPATTTPSYSIPSVPTPALPGRLMWRQAIRLILTKAILTRTRSEITSRSSQITPAATWRIRLRLTSIPLGDNTRKTFITCGCFHRAEQHPRPQLRRLLQPAPQPAQLQQRLQPPQLQLRQRLL